MTSAGRNEPPTQLDSTNRYPELKFRKSAVLSLAYDEYCRREASGETIDRGEFCRAFPEHQESVARLLSVYRYLKEHSLLPDESAVCESWPEAGETVAGFRLLDGLGLGAFARVYIAEEPAVANRRVVVKATVEGAGEVDVLGKLAHPNIVQILSVRQDEQRRWTLISMPYLGQATLDDVIWQTFAAAKVRPRQARQLLEAIEKINGLGISPEPATADPWLQKQSYVDGVVHLISQLADALAYTHAKGICHRDLKPSNVLLAAGGRPMLLDFNLAQDEQASGRRLGGTLPYMAPEQLLSTVLEPRSGPPQIDPRSDLYSLAVIAYEMLCGEWPYGPIPEELTHDEFATELFERQRIGPTPLVERNSEIGAEISALVERCLSFEAAERPQTAAEMAAEWRRILTPGRRARRWASQHRRWVASAAIGLLSLAALGGYYVVTLPPYGERELHAAKAALDRRDLPAAIGHIGEAALHLPREGKAALAEMQYRVGKAAFDAGDYGLADEYFTHALNRDYAAQDVWFYRGAARFRRAMYNDAHSDFMAAAKAREGSWARAQLYACQGDCSFEIAAAGSTVATYRSAIVEGYKTITVLNNLGLACIINGQPRGFNFEEAEAYLSEAIDDALAHPAEVSDAKRLALYYNRAMNELRYAAMQQRKCDERAKQDVRQALALAPNRYMPQLLAADVFALHADKEDPDWRAAVGHMREAIRLGAPPSQTGFSSQRAELLEAVRSLPEGNAILAARKSEGSEPSPGHLSVLDDLIP